MHACIGVIGYGGEDQKLNDISYEVGREIALHNCVLVCGGLGGVMESSCAGARDEGGLTVGILPGKSKSDANRFVDIPVVTGIGEARNVVLVRSSDVLIAIGGGFGTLTEISYALKLEIPVVGLKTWDISDKITRAENASDAVEIACKKAGLK